MDRLAGLPATDDFADVLDPSRYSALPADWVLGLTDVVASTEAIAAGRYKAVNMAGAAAISAVMNAISSPSFPFSFGGDGCAFALPAQDRENAERALGETVVFAREELGLELRAAVVPVEALAAAGRMVKVLLYRPSPHVAYAMFDGGGMAYAEKRMKAGEFTVAPRTGRADLTGLSCFWLPIKARNGAILSIIARPGPSGDAAAFRAAVRQVVASLADTAPVPPEGPRPAFVTGGVGLTARAGRASLPRWRRILGAGAINALGAVLFRTGLTLGSFRPRHYRQMTAQNADTRKFGDALMMTVDASPAVEDAVWEALSRAAADGILEFGIHRQDEALMTCVVPSYGRDDHFHFVDGAKGGYAAAAMAFSD